MEIESRCVSAVGERGSDRRGGLFVQRAGWRCSSSEPAKPRADFWTAAIDEIRGNEPLDDMMARWGIAYLRELAPRYEVVPPYDDAPDYYRDFDVPGGPLGTPGFLLA